ncbi:hypothetical protein BUALT_Bualt01G0166000 [Buddleja alternifolia]|uniref:Glycosyltransferase 61 catalytic domain-containing protein n=1 Tax=Buddleja alternifolia TaxID=168488 RepID=A0AAV6YA23_9LAMI|nr:hypothetical protein BUALT_Bualt01G0166000 [Buddleja alternifolia]
MGLPISDIKLIRTDTTLDLSQKAEKGCIQEHVGDALYMLSEEDMVLSEDSEAGSTVGSAANLQLPITAQNMLVVNDTSIISQPIEIETKKVEPLCRISKAYANYCEIEGDVRIDPNSSTVFVVTKSINSSYSLSMQPYPRKGISHVKNWTISLISDYDDNMTIPKCSQTHNFPAILFSIGGFSGNHFHDFADLILPLYTTSFRFHKDVHFLASDYKPWWPSKFRGVLKRLSRHDVVDIDREKQVRCYDKMVVGLQFHKELIVDPSSESPVSMYQFREFLRQTYSLQRTKAIKWKKGHATTSPRLMIISRKRTRILTNELQLSQVAKRLGYEVVLAEAEVSTNLTRFAQTVNSCDVLMGIHGAGLTNMVFLPDNAILIQVVPLGRIDGFARLDFGNPASDMNIRYLEYKITMKESSLSQQYPMDHPFLRDPLSFHRKGWEKLRSIYLDNQNVTIDIHRFKPNLANALKLLRH